MGCNTSTFVCFSSRLFCQCYIILFVDIVVVCLLSKFRLEVALSFVAPLILCLFGLKITLQNISYCFVEEESPESINTLVTRESNRFYIQTNTFLQMYFFEKDNFSLDGYYFPCYIK